MATIQGLKRYARLCGHRVMVQIEGAAYQLREVRSSALSDRVVGLSLQRVDGMERRHLIVRERVLEQAQVRPGVPLALEDINGQTFVLTPNEPVVSDTLLLLLVGAGMTALALYTVFG
ncbi:MAG: hypothetical protein AWU57_37 [Marinobacter sp. T13-3]|nr:MAG: hypothetical protein AWU57_37 [Marinobacter sp. T13-3]